MYNQKMYSEEEQQKAIITFRDGINLEINGDKRMNIKEGDEVTLIGEYTFTEKERKLRQYIFTVDGKYISSIWEENVKVLPKEELKLGDYVRIIWSDFEELLYVVKKDKDGGYNLIQLGAEYKAFSGEKTLSKLLAYMKESCVVASYEILPKDKHKVDVVKK